MSQNCETNGPVVHPRVIREHGVSWWWWWWCRLGITPDSSTRALWQSYQQRHLGKVGGMDEGAIQNYFWSYESFRQLVVLLGRGSARRRPLPTQGSTQRKTNTNIHTVSVIRTHDLSDQSIKTYSDRAATGTGCNFLRMWLSSHEFMSLYNYGTWS
jgi:hypothetical protein